jgi:GNAT superfamily N-acetyltransferase
MPNLSEVVVRRARDEDYGQACVLLDALDMLHIDRASWMFTTPDEQPRSQRFFEQLLKTPDAAVFVADAGGLVGVAYGWMKGAPDFAVFIRQRWGVLDGLVVDPAWRRRGIGKSLAQAFERWALDLDAAWVEVNVYEFNPEASKFYQELGYLPLSQKMRKPRQTSSDQPPALKIAAPTE